MIKYGKNIVGDHIPYNYLIFMNLLIDYVLKLQGETWF